VETRTSEHVGVTLIVLTETISVTNCWTLRYGSEDKYVSPAYLQCSDNIGDTNNTIINYIISKHNKSGLGGLEVACWPLVPNFGGSNPAEAVGFFRAKKSSARLPSEGK
jgi:hypothetical protein